MGGGGSNDDHLKNPEIVHSYTMDGPSGDLCLLSTVLNSQFAQINSLAAWLYWLIVVAGRLFCSDLFAVLQPPPTYSTIQLIIVIMAEASDLHFRSDRASPWSKFNSQQEELLAQ